GHAERQSRGGNRVGSLRALPRQEWAGQADADEARAEASGRRTPSQAAGPRDRHERCQHRPRGGDAHAQEAWVVTDVGPGPGLVLAGDGAEVAGARAATRLAA